MIRTQLFSLQDATSNATESLCQTKDAETCYIPAKKFPIVKLALTLASALLVFVSHPTFEAFALYVVSQMWEVITTGDAKPLTYDAVLVTHYHAL